MSPDSVSSVRSSSISHGGALVYTYSAWQAEQVFDIALDVLHVPYGPKDFAMTVEALDERGVPIRELKTNWSFSEKFDSQFCYVPNPSSPGFCGMQSLSFQVPVNGLKVAIRPWHSKNAHLESMFGDVVVRQYYSSDPMDPSAAKLGSHVGIATREKI